MIQATIHSLKELTLLMIFNQMIQSNNFNCVEHFKQELEKYLKYYNHKRIKAKLKGMSSVQYRAHAQQAA
ncbi:IS3 family transposase [Bacillus sp. AFS073361]|uniref:IS3 family transposase n=1 Tax=Bacillus sp. AFS073361 TaxID=2033511 RepID=UPI00211D3610|nr:IS3 family transposase [Bacillus sp. AFS073361]